MIKIHLTFISQPSSFPFPDFKLKISFRIAEYVLTYNQANRAVAILCNHKRTAPKTFDDQMKRADAKIEDKEVKIEEKRREVKQAKRVRHTYKS